MGSYRCEHCGAALDTDRRRGEREQCPACRKYNVVPEPTLTRLGGAVSGWWHERKLRREEARKRRDRSDAAMEEAIAKTSADVPEPAETAYQPVTLPASLLPRSPRYSGLEVLAALIALCGVLCWVAAAVVVAVGLRAAGEGSTGGVLGGAVSLVSGGCLGLVGLVLVGTGQFFSCVRDIAINTFNTAAMLAARED